ncbi:hypothetical protein G6F57_014537 [Rhizopus arrhizus]|nr:hypothetical protein G6F57_014537 [Rhizopus arrhizus]
MSDTLPDYWDCFSVDYAAARQAFVAVATQRGAALSRHEHPTLKDPHGQALSVDVAVLGRADAPRTHLAISGTHGLEGAAGSAVQIGWLRADGGNPLPDDVNVVLVHALNPYGYAYDTRTTENNVDLNRNFIDHTRPTPATPHYATLHPHLIPDAWTEASLEAGARAVEAFRETHGADALFNTTASGQYTHPDGLVYGGSGPEWSNRTLRRIVDEPLAARALRMLCSPLATPRPQPLQATRSFGAVARPAHSAIRCRRTTNSRKPSPTKSGSYTAARPLETAAVKPSCRTPTR